MTLTRYPAGSIRELFAISFPLMLSSFSVMLMLFVDRWLLAHYSLAAMNAAVSASTLGWAFVISVLGLTNISEVFVAQYNGAKKWERIGEPVWQMFWCGCATVFLFFPLAIWGGDFIYGSGPERTMEKDYFCWMMYFGPSIALYGALTGFFVGQGKLKVITILSFTANVVNALLDYMLIFGVDGWIPELGVKGAAIATSASSLFQAAVLLIIFLSKENRLRFGTGRWRPQWELMKHCLKIGIPGAVFMMVEMFGWGIYYIIMSKKGFEYITVAVITQNIVILFYFLVEGVSKAATAIVGNFIGAQDHWSVPKLLLSGIRLHFIFFVILSVLFFLGSDVMINQFLPFTPEETLDSLHKPLVISIACMIFYMFFEGVRFLISGILTAGGDTMFLLLGGSLSMWVLLVLPVSLAVFYFNASIEVASFLCLLYAAAASCIYYLRYKKGSWKTSSLLIRG